MYNCKKCNDSNLILQNKSHNTGLYCKSCGTWQKWLNKEEVRTAEFNGIPVFEGPITTDVLIDKSSVDTKTIRTSAGSIEDLFVNSAPFEDNNTIDVKDKLKAISNNNSKSLAEVNDEDTITIEIPVSQAREMLKLISNLEKQIKIKLK